MIIERKEKTSGIIIEMSIRDFIGTPNKENSIAQLNTLVHLIEGGITQNVQYMWRIKGLSEYKTNHWVYER